MVAERERVSRRRGQLFLQRRGELGQKPRQDDFDPHAVGEHVDAALDLLCQRDDADIRALAAQTISECANLLMYSFLS